MRLKLLFVIVSAALILTAATAAVLAQADSPNEVPEPYRGLKNPFPWSDVSTQEAGKDLYKGSCLGCHGFDGSNIPDADFSTADFSRSMEESPDFFFWILSEGMLDKGMPPYKSSLSEEQRWQLLTYVWSLGAAVTPEPTPTEGPTERGNATLFLSAPDQAQSGEPLNLMAVLKDSQGEPIKNAEVRFFLDVDFFASGLMEIGEAVTDDQGVALLEYTPRLAGDIAVVARYEGDGFNPVEAGAALALMGGDKRFYSPEAGIHLPAPGEEVFIGPESARELGEMGRAPSSAFRLPGGVLSWLWLFVAVVMVVWGSYFLVMYQVLRIPGLGGSRDPETRLVPLVGMAIVVFTGIVLALMILIGPNSNLHLR